MYKQGSQTRGLLLCGLSAACGPQGHFVRPAMGEFSFNQDVRYAVYSPVFKSSRPASEQVPFERT